MFKKLAPHFRWVNVIYAVVVAIVLAIFVWALRHAHWLRIIGY